ncbi:formyltransferase family protein, partial [Klebsiella pneumoniae]|uniref:formyltransferase family protein n=1 Tax=Klebsiella pneumoniae TaxID=573 RepID=UPI00272F69B1
HEDMRSLTEWYGIPYHYIPVDAANKQASFDKVQAQIDGARADCVVLARYMQILPPALCERYVGRVINIHHSFLPSFA